jgi:predicted DNA-binding transcriptional regulator AlpA
MNRNIPTPPGSIPAALANFDILPDSAHVRLPVVAALRGSSPATVWRHVKAGLLPAPVKLGPNTTAWRVGDLRRAADVGRALGEV